MDKAIFITGASGFIGRFLLKRASELPFDKIFCLSRNDCSYFGSSEKIMFIKGEIFDSGSYQAYLDQSDTIVHLAAATGKVPISEYFRVNTAGTEHLIRASREAGVRDFMFVSTIAVKYKNKSRYYYAQSKEEAEEGVRNSELNYSIVRPTIVIGKESPGWLNLKKLATAPIPLVFGRGDVRIQPIFIDDLVNCFLTILKNDRFKNSELDLGGPETLSMQEFFVRIHKKYRGKDTNIRHLPLKPIISTLSVLEKVAYPLLPLNVGQLSSFFNNSIIEENDLFLEMKPKMKNIDAMLEELNGNGQFKR